MFPIEKTPFGVDFRSSIRREIYGHGCSRSNLSNYCALFKEETNFSKFVNFKRLISGLKEISRYL